MVKDKIFIVSIPTANPSSLKDFTGILRRALKGTDFNYLVTSKDIVPITSTEYGIQIEGAIKRILESAKEAQKAAIDGYLEAALIDKNLALVPKPAAIEKEKKKRKYHKKLKDKAIESLTKEPFNLPKSKEKKEGGKND